jgi:hypothetical protein
MVVSVMSMYRQLLSAAIEERRPAAVESTPAEALSTLFQCRDRLRSWGKETDWTSRALADQVAYDIALIELARCVGIDCGIDTFDRPERRRLELTRELTARGIDLDGGF